MDGKTPVNQSERAIDFEEKNRQGLSSSFLEYYQILLLWTL